MINVLNILLTDISAVKTLRCIYYSICQIHLKTYLCKNFGFQEIGTKRELGENPKLSPQL